MRDFLEQARALGAGLIHLYHAGHVRDVSGNGNDGSVLLGSPRWEHRDGGYMLQCRDGALTVPHAVSLAASSKGALLFFGDFSQMADSIAILLTKQNVSGREYGFEFYGPLGRL